jgi:hypothetical protein
MKIGEASCCPPKENEKKGLWQGIVFGLLPHSFCLAFLVLSVVGAVAATTFLRKLLLTPFFFQILIGLSFAMATISAAVYLKRGGLLSVKGIVKKWQYLLGLYGTTIGVNLLMFLVIFPLLTNISLTKRWPGVLSQRADTSSLILQVEIPCSGHAPLIIDELGKSEGISEVKFIFPDQFQMNYDFSQTSQEQILNLEIFKTFKAKMI